MNTIEKEAHYKMLYTAYDKGYIGFLYYLEDYVNVETHFIEDMFLRAIYNACMQFRKENYEIRDNVHKLTEKHMYDRWDEPSCFAFYCFCYLVNDKKYNGMKYREYTSLMHTS